VDALYVDWAGNVGIGTTSPAAALELSASTGDLRYVKFTNSNTGTNSADGFKVGINGQGAAFIAQQEAWGITFLTSDIERMTLDSAGRLGVGVSNPDQTLDVAGTIEMTGFKLPTDAMADYVLTSDGNGVGTWQAASGGSGDGHSLDASDGSPIDAVYVNASGNVGVGTSSPAEKLHVAGDIRLNEGGDIAFYDDNTRIYESSDDLSVTADDDLYLRPDGDMYILADAGADWIRFNTGTQQVGIGTTSPSAELDVAGTIEMTGFKLPTDAMADYVLTSDGSGVGTWQPASGGAGDGHSLDAMDGSPVDAVYVDASGDVGVGTASPSARIDVVASTGKAGEFYSTGTGTDYTVVGHNPNNTCAVFCSKYTPGAYGLTAAVIGIGGSDSYGGWFSSQGSAPGVKGQSNGTGRAVEGSAFGTGYAGYFHGGQGVYVSGDINVTGDVNKAGGTFKIDHPLDPENKYLYHSFVESPDRKNIYDGVVQLDAQGSAWVNLPEWFQALNRDFRYQLTAIGGPGPNLHIAEKIAGNRFRIAGGVSGMEVSWQVTGIRQDPYAQMHPMSVEEDKAGEDVGRYLHPEAYGLSPELAIGYQAVEE
jgi:hypothetical protein